MESQQNGAPDETTATTATARPADLLSHGGRTALWADWVDATFVHFAVEPRELQPRVPLPLDVLDGRAYVSLVAFTQRRLRPAAGGRLAARLAAPVARHPFLNLRTYVRVDGEPAIHFLIEWIPNRLAALIGPITYGLPYRLGRLDYAPDGSHGRVRWRGSELTFATRTRTTDDAPARCTDQPAGPSGTPRRACDGFLLERYAAWTMRDGVARRFRIWHAPWEARRTDVTLPRRSLLDRAAPWLAGAVPALAHRSPGVGDVRIGFPECVTVTPVNSTG